FPCRARHSRSPLLRATADDVAIRRLVVPCLIALGALAPRRNRMTTTGGTAFSAAMRMVDRVHRHAADYRALAEPAIAAGLADRNVLIVRVRDSADRRHAFGAHHAHLAGGETQQRITGIAADELRESPSRARELAALAGLHLDIVDNGADRNVAHRHRIARFHVDTVARDHFIAGGKTLRRQYVAKLAVFVFDQREKARTVRIVLQPHDFSRAFLAPLEIDGAQAALVAATALEHGDAAAIVAPARTVLAFGQILDRAARP